METLICSSEHCDYCDDDESLLTNQSPNKELEKNINKTSKTMYVFSYVL